MEDQLRLSFGEFLQDIRGVVASPARRFSIIHERGAMWGSLLLLILPAYFGFSFVGGVYFDKEPFPGYVFLLPVVVAVLFSCLKIFCIHLVARLLEGKGRYFAATGRLRDLFVVFGYTGVPSIIALCLALTLFMFASGQLGYLLRNFHVLVVSVLIAVGIGLFIWNLILAVLALRNVYPMRDYKIVIAVILGPALFAAPAMSVHLLVGSVEIDSVYLMPDLNPRMMQLFATDPSAQDVRRSRVDIHLDKLTYKFKQPQRFEFAIYNPEQPLPGKEDRKQGGAVIGEVGAAAGDKKGKAVGRIIGLPGEKIEMIQGKVYINGGYWIEPYMTPEWQGGFSLPSRVMGSSEYFILPSDRHLLESGYADIVVSRSRILGRMVTNRWPLMWLFFRPTINMKGHPENRTGSS